MCDNNGVVTAVTNELLVLALATISVPGQHLTPDTETIRRYNHLDITADIWAENCLDSILPVQTSNYQHCILISSAVQCARWQQSFMWDVPVQFEITPIIFSSSVDVENGIWKHLLYYTLFALVSSFTTYI